MKKRFVSLLLILTVCVGICACGARMNKDQLSAVCGIWYLQPYHENENNPGYFELKTDGTGTFRGEESLTWSAGKSNVKGVLPPVFLELENGDEYTLEMRNGDSGYDEAVLNAEGGENAARYFKVDTQIKNPWFGELQTKWYAVEGTVKTVTLNADGTVLLDDRACFWSNAADWAYNEDYIQLNLFDARGVFGYISAEVRENGLYELRVHDNADGRGYNCYAHRMMPVLSGVGSWVSLDRYTMIDDQFSIIPRQDTATIGETDYKLLFDTETDEEALTVNFLADNTVCYTARIFMEGEYPMATLTEAQTGRQTLYRNDHYGYDKENRNVRYDLTVNLIYAYANGHGLYDLDTDTYIEPDDRLAYIYKCLADLGEHEQAGEFLDRFIVVPDKLTAIIQCCTDSGGKVTETLLNWYGYDESGVLIRGCGEDLIEKYGVFADTTQNFFYDSRGNIAKIEVGTNAVYAVGTPIFDTVGKLIGMTVHRQGEKDTSVYTYNADRQPIRLKIPTADYGDERIYEYTYDDTGRLIAKERVTGEGRYVVAWDYIYDGDRLAEVHQTATDCGSGYHWNYVFTNDEQGRPLTATVETNAPDYADKAVEIRFVYEDIYFFDTAGLVLGKD